MLQNFWDLGGVFLHFLYFFTICLRYLLEVMEAKEEHPRLKHNKLPLTQEEIIQKREKRKQSNRESARRSRLRKQLELAHLELHVEVLIDEKNFLTKELKRISAKCDRLASQNVSLKAELSRHIGPAEVPEVIDDLQSVAAEGSN